VAESVPWPPVLNHQFRNFADKHIIFDDQYHSHQNSFGHDKYHRGYQNSSRQNHGYQSPSYRYQGIRRNSQRTLKFPKAYSFLKIKGRFENYRVISVAYAGLKST
jgi:hypothetical protein